MYKLELSIAADGDLDAIYTYGIQHWGEAQADAYFDRMIEHFADICRNPFLYPAIDDIRLGYRRSICGVHRIYYQVTEDVVLVSAILGKQDFDARN